MAPRAEPWREVAGRQAGLISHAQLRATGVSPRAVAHRVRGERWQWVAPAVVATVTGALSPEQRLWLGVLHAGTGAIVGGVAAAELAGLRNWTRDECTVLVPYESRVPGRLPGFRFVRSRRDLTSMRARGRGVPRCRLEPAVLLFAAGESSRTGAGILAASVQQRRTTAEQLVDWLDRLAPLRGASPLRRTLIEIAGGAESVAELDVTRMCRAAGLATPRRQVRRRDRDGRLRFIDCEWTLVDGRTLALEVDGAFHMDVEQWEDDLARQRALTATDHLIVRCTSRELRDEPERIAAHLRMLGVPRAARGCESR